MRNRNPLCWQHAHSSLLLAAFCLATAHAANADVIYKCNKGSKVIYQDEPCVPGKYQANVLTARNARGAINFIPGENAKGSGKGGLPSLEVPRFTESETLLLEEKQRLLGKPAIKAQLDAQSPIESRTQSVWQAVKRWFATLFD